MKRTPTVVLFLVAGVFLYGSAFALDTYIPHITGGSADWTDYLQVNNDASSTANFTLTLYNNEGAQIYSQVHSAGGLSHSQIALKTLNAHAQTGKITYTETGLVFRVSYESTGGGVAEFRTINNLGSKIGLYFSDFAALVQWKGVAIANMGTTAANVTLYALGGGSILGTYTVTIAPKTRIDDILSAWFNVNLGQIESIVAVTGSSSLCGIALSSDTALSRLLFTPSIPISPGNWTNAQCLYVIAPSVSTSMEARMIMAQEGWSECAIRNAGGVLVVVRSMLFDPLNYSYESLCDLQKDADWQLNIVGEKFHVYIYSVDDDLRVTQLKHISYKAD